MIVDTYPCEIFSPFENQPNFEMVRYGKNYLDIFLVHTQN